MGNSQQIIEIARGNLVKRLTAKALAKGELFLHYSDVLLEDSIKVNNKGILDLCTNTYITRLNKGDLLAGNNSKNEVWYLGSGSSLKWGGLWVASSVMGTSESEAWTEELKNHAAKNPNTIFMYAGDTSVTLYSGSDLNANNKELTKKYSASNSSEYLNVINPGDLFFFSPVLDQIVAIHLSHSTDALTKINVNALISQSMKTSEFGIGEGKVGTLKDFLDYPARHYQYLLENSGWGKVTTTLVDKEYADGEPLQYNVALPEDGDGQIHYIPFNDGLGVYLFESQTLHEGDLILSVPDYSADNKGGVKHKVVSLYGKMLDLLNPRMDIKRVDTYADTLWAVSGKGNLVSDPDVGYTGDDDLQNKALSVTDLIDRLFRTKVDTDPATGKIISSQLPDWLLGAPKYQGPAKVDFTSKEGLTGEGYAKLLMEEAKWNNLDGNVDAEGENTDIKKDANGNAVDYDDKLQNGCYWIWQGGPKDITEFTSIFRIVGDPDDDATSLENADSTDTDHKLSHVLNNGDYIIYNNGLFDIIDNTSNFVGLHVKDKILSGVVDVTGKVRDPASWKDNITETVINVPTHETDVRATEDTLEIISPNTVIFKVDDKNNSVLTDESYLPVISSTGVAHNSRLNLLDKQTAIKIAGSEGSVGPKSVTLDFGPNLDATTARTTSTRRTGDTKTPVGTKEFYITYEDGSTVYIDTEIATGLDEGFNFEDLYFSDEVTDCYKWSIPAVAEPVLSLPQHSGTLATEQYVNYGFAVVKQIIDDLTKKIKDDTTKGTIDWLQTIRYRRDANGALYKDKKGNYVKEIFDSRIFQDKESSNYFGLNLYGVDPWKTDGSLDEAKVVNAKNFTTLRWYADLAGLGSTYNADFDYTLEGLEGKLNPSEYKGDVVNILPNHSGIILNNNSVIDGGEWL